MTIPPTHHRRAAGSPPYHRERRARDAGHKRLPPLSVRAREYAEEDLIVEQIVGWLGWSGVRLESGVHFVDVPAPLAELRRQAVHAPLGARK